MQSECLRALQGVAVTSEYLMSRESNYKLCEYGEVERGLLQNTSSCDDAR